MSAPSQFLLVVVKTDITALTGILHYNVVVVFVLISPLVLSRYLPTPSVSGGNGHHNFGRDFKSSLYFLSVVFPS